MNKYYFFLKFILKLFFVINLIFFSTLNAKNLDKFNDGSNISDYFSGILLLNENKYIQSNRFLRNLEGLEENHIDYSINYIYSLVNSGKINEAYFYSKKLEKKKLNIFESDLIIGIYYFKRKKYDLAEKYFTKIKKRNSPFLINNFLSNSLLIWSGVTSLNLEKTQIRIQESNSKFDNIEEIQNVFLHCFYQNPKTEILFKKLVSNKKVDFSRYNYFYASYLANIEKFDEAKRVINQSAKLQPNNILLQQLDLDLSKANYKKDFNCRKQSHVIAEIFYITANALSLQSMYKLSNFYLNLSKYLNSNFQAFDTLLAENFYKIENYNKAIKIYHDLSKKGQKFDWYSAKQISKILILQDKKKQSIAFLENRYKKLIDKNIYEKFDFAEFLKSNGQYKKSIKIYSEIINLIEKNHELYSEVTDGRGVAYERIGEWEKAEKDLLLSLKSNPNQAYVINYLAYSWIEKGIKIEQSLKMLEKANKLKSNDPYIVDSLGWALFKLKRYKDSKKYLQQAVQLMPADPIINDHYGDVLWKNGNSLQARYYWNYVLNLDETEEDLKQIVKNKLLSGL